MVSIYVFLSLFEHVGGMFFFNRKKSTAIDEDIEEEQDSFLCKFVKDGAGRKIGESVTIDSDVLIIKSKEKFLGVPLKHIEDQGKTLLVKGLVDLDKAYEMGERWRTVSFNMDDEKTNNGGEKKHEF